MAMERKSRLGLMILIKIYLESESKRRTMAQLAVNQWRKGRGHWLFEPLQVLFIAIPD